MDLNDSVVIVTGASSGIGAATSVELGRRGAVVGMIARRADRLATVADEVEAAGGMAHWIQVDVSDSSALVQAVDAFASRWGRVDVLVNNAGYGYWERLAEADPNEWRKEVEVNLLAPMYATSAALKHMNAAGRGHLVNISSMASRAPASHGAGYVSSKAALNIFSDSVLMDLNRQGIKATLIETGEVATEMQTADDIASMKMLDASDVADAIVYVLTRPDHVCIKDIQLFAPKTG